MTYAESQLFPEIEFPEFAARVPLTIKEGPGFIRVRPPRRVGRTLRPALYVAPAFQAELAAVAQDITRHRAQNQKTDTARIERAAEAVLGRDSLQAAYSRYPVLQDAISSATTLRELWDKVIAACLAAAPVDVVQRVRSNNGRWCVLLETGFAGFPLVVPVPVPPKALAKALVAPTPEDAVAGVVAERWRGLEEHAANLWASWQADRPSWFSAEELAMWAAEHALAATGQLFSIAHPLSARMHDSDWMGHRTPEGAIQVSATCLFEGESLPLFNSYSPADLMHVMWTLPEAGQQQAMEKALARAAQEVRAAAEGVYTRLTAELFRQPKFSKLAPATRVQFARASLARVRGARELSLAEFAGLFRKTMEQGAAQWLDQHVLEQCRAALPDDLKDFYPTARKMKRRLTLIVGPTNSGKTHGALEALKRSYSGTYLAPLRLLALEVRDRLVADGVPTSLVTGELQEIDDAATHVAATVEMLDVTRQVETAVIDEVQMLADPDRGVSWLRAVLGVAARQVFLIGAPEIRAAVESLAEYLDEPLEIIEKHRLSELHLHDKPTELEALPHQSAIIAFSRKEVLELAMTLREKHNRVPAVIYGALSPESRKEQARRFAENEADVLVATDAIGMGLNLPIAKMYFSTAVKWDGKKEAEVPKDLTWQIAGRAGRYGMHERGEVGALDKLTLSRIHAAMASRPEGYPVAFSYAIDWPILEPLARHLDTDKLVPVLRFFKDKLTFLKDTRFTPQLSEGQEVLAPLLDTTTLSLRDKFILSLAPVTIRQGEVPDYFKAMLSRVELGTPLSVVGTTGLCAAKAEGTLMTAEQAVQRLTTYCWLHYRYPEVFPDRGAALQEIAILDARISVLLAKPGKKALR